MRTQPIPLVGGSYADETRPWSQQDTVNYLPCLAEESGTRTEAMLKTPPGLRPFVEIAAVGTTPSPPVRRTHNCEGKLFSVIGRTLYKITNTGVAIPIGTVPGFGRCAAAHNQISLGNELLIVNGQAGYIYNTVTDTFGRITDPGYPGSATAVFIDGYFVQIEPHGRYAFNSDVANGMEYNTLDRFTSEVSPDKLVAPAVLDNKLLLLSQTSGEWFQNSGASQQPFRSTRITMEKGCAGAYTVAHADNSIFFLGSDGMFYTVEGYRPVRISKRPLEQAIRGLNWSEAFAEVWEDAGFTVVYWTFPDGRTWGYNTADKEWHRRESLGMDRWRVNTLTRWNDRWIAGDFQTGRLWDVSWDYLGLEGDEEYISERTLAVIHDNQNKVLIPRFEVVMDPGQIETVPIPFPEQPDPPTIAGDAPDASIGVYPGFAYTLGGGTPPYNVTVRPGGILPPGLTINSQGEIDDGPTTTLGTFEFTLRVTDSNGLYAELEDSISIGALMMALLAVSVGSSWKTSGGTDWSMPWTNDLTLGNNGLELLASDTAFLTWSIGSNPDYTTDFGPTWQASTGDPQSAVGGPRHGWYNSQTGTMLLPQGGGGGVHGVNRSTDGGVSFTESGTIEISMIAAVGEDWVAISNDGLTMYLSADDGLTWNAGTAVSAFSFANGGTSHSFNGVARFGASTNFPYLPKIIKTIDGVSVSTETLPTLTGAVTGALAGGRVGEFDRWVAGTNDGQIIYLDDDGVWKLSTDTLGCTAYAAVWNGVVFVMAGGSGGTDANAIIKTSVNGKDWVLADTTSLSGGHVLRGLAVLIP